MEEKKENMYQKLRKFFSTQAIIGIVIGIIAGYLYYLKVGCTSGTCPITSSPWMSMLWGSVIGYLLGDMFTKKKSKEDK
jgi:xanthine/uracil permease